LTQPEAGMDASLVAAWQELCQLLSDAFTKPTFLSFLHLATGWVLCRSQPAVTNLIRTIGPSLLGQAAKHWSSYEHFFYRAAWSVPEVGRLLLQQVVWPLLVQHGREQVMQLDLDDTTVSRRGRHVAYAAYFKDASAGNCMKKVVHWSHNWLIAAVAMRPGRWPGWVLGLPVLFALYRKRCDCDRQHPFQTRQQLAADLIRQARQTLPQVPLRVVADGQYATQDVAAACRQCQAPLISRIRTDAALYDLAPKPSRRRRGPVRRRGRRLPTPPQIAARRRTGWKRVRVLMYGRRPSRLVLGVKCLWWHVCKDQPVKLLIVRDPAGKEKDQYLVCTDASLSDREILRRFAARWPIEEVIRQGKQLDQIERLQGWSAHTVLRQLPLGLIVQTLVKAWFLGHGVRAAHAQPHGASAWSWAAAKAHPSYLDMLATLRRVLWTARFNTGNSGLFSRVRGVAQSLLFTVCAAA
jgi:hypothetical protein